ncbi:MAG TPA: hypothetical protein VGH19_09070 [Verrucomicrobiae bacterium]
MRGIKTAGVLLVIALWLSSSFFAHSHRWYRLGRQTGNTLSFLNTAIADEEPATAIFPAQQFRTSVSRASTPQTDGPTNLILRDRTEPARFTHLQSDAPGLAPAMLARTWQFLLRAAPHPRSPSPA